MNTTTTLLEGQRSDIKGVQIEVWGEGTGHPLVFLHPGDGLDPHAEFVSRMANRYSVLAPWHPGFGNSHLPEHFNSVDDLAYFYLDFLESRGLRNAVILGVSFGAWIAAEMAIKNKDHIGGLILVDALGAKFQGRMTREIGDLFSLSIFDQAKLIYHDLNRRSPSFADAPEEYLVRLARSHESFSLYGWSPTLHNPKLAHRLHRIQVPTLVVWGADDRVVSTAYGREYASRIPGARFEVIENAGHYPHLEQPVSFDKVIDGFISGLAR